MKYVAFCSYGKDSLAQVILLKSLGYPLDEVVNVDIKYNPTISGEHPIMAKWIPTADKILKEQFNITVKHITAPKTFIDYFYTIKQKGNRVGECYGFPFMLGAWCNSRLKVEVINKYIKSLNDDVIEYVGIAYDEPDRYKRLIAKNNKHITYQSILFDRQITEQMAFDICAPYGLISPIYNKSYRGGCWFCGKQCMADLYDLWLNYNDYFLELKRLESDSKITFKPKTTIKEIEQKFINGYKPTRRKIKNAK